MMIMNDDALHATFAVCLFFSFVSGMIVMVRREIIEGLDCLGV